MFRLLLAILLLMPCPGCAMQRLASVTRSAPTPPICDCCDHHDSEDSEPSSPLSKPECQCQQPAVVALPSDQTVDRADLVSVPTEFVIEQPLLPTDVTVGGHLQVSYATGPTRSSPLRR